MRWVWNGINLPNLIENVLPTTRNVILRGIDDTVH